jgi:hypothetical protein
VSYLVGNRDSEYAMAFMDDLRSRLASRVQRTTDGHKAYLQAVEDAFGDDVDYSMLVKLYGEAPKTEARYSPAVCIGARKDRITGNPGANRLEPHQTSRFRRPVTIALQVATAAPGSKENGREGSPLARPSQ